MKQIASITLLALLTLFTLSCRKETHTSGDPVNLKSVTVGFPAKVVSSRGNLTVTFSKPLVENSFVGTAVSDNPFECKPAIKGAAVWVSTSSIALQPAAPLKSGQSYSVILHGDKLLGSQRCTDAVTFDFTAAPQEIIASSYDFEPVPGKKNTLRIKIELEFAETIDLNKFNSDFELKGKKKLDCDFSVGKTPRHITVYSSEIVRGESAQAFAMTLPKQYTADQTEWKSSIIVPESTGFAVMYHGESSDRDKGVAQYSFTFSDPIRRDIDLSGYVSVTPNVRHTVKVQNKQLILEGDFEGGIPYDVSIATKFPSQFGTATREEQQYQLIFDNEKPRIEWLSPGSLISSENKSRVQIKSINVKRVYITVTEVYRDNLGFFFQNNGLEDLDSQDDNDDYEYYYGESGYSDLERVGEVVAMDTIQIDTARNHWVRSELDLSKLFKTRPGSGYVVSLNFDQTMLTGEAVSTLDNYAPGKLFYGEDNYYTNPTQYGYYYKHGTKQKLLIASDVGLTVKEHDSGYTVFAVNVNRATPEENMKISLFNYQNFRIAEGTTDKDGVVFLKADSTKRAHYILGEGKSGLAVTKLAGGEWNTSTFEVDGAGGETDGTELFLYADRGVHRPGDTIFLSGILRLNRKFPPKKLPVTITVTNSMGTTAFEANGSEGILGHYSWAIPTGGSDPTGMWNATVTVGNKQFRKNLPVETIKPNRLKVTHTIPNSIAGERVTGKVTTRYLFGTPAANLAATVFATVSESRFTPKQFLDFVFDSPVKQYSQRSFTLFEGTLDENGICAVEGTIEAAKLAPSILSSNFSLRVQETGGSTVDKNFNATIYPYSHYVGVSDPFDWGSAPVGTKTAVPVVVVDPSGKAVAGRKMVARLYINKRHWWWDYDNRDRQDFRTMEQTYLISEQQIISGSKPVNFQFEIEDDGQHYIAITDLASGHETGMFFYGSRWAGEGRTGRGEETYLPIQINRGSFNPGDVAQIGCDAPDSAMAILTIEQNNKIICRMWGKSKGGRVSFNVPVTTEMLPNCYAVLQLIQPHRRTGNDLPHALFGIKPFTVEQKSTHLDLALKAPEEIKPEQKFSITVNNRSKDKATATIAIVDEGLLDLTGFGTPNPWEHFFRKLRLAVISRDNFRWFLNALLPDMDRLFSIGGDDDESSRKDRLGDSDSKRFVPVVMFTKPVTIGGRGSKTVTFTMPNYVGEVRVMVIGAGESSFGSVSKQIPVRQPVMVLPTLPRTVRPGDQFQIPVSVFAMKPSIKQAVVTISTRGGVVLRSAKSQTVTFDKPGEKDISFEAIAGKTVGVDTVVITVVSGKEKNSSTVILPIQSANPFYTQVTDTICSKDRTIQLPVASFGYQGTNRAKLSLSRTPDIQLEKRVSDLIHYPYGCIEQTTSSVIPQLVLDKIVELSDVRKKMITDNVNAGIERLSTFRDGSAFSYWPLSQGYGSYRSDWGGLYASHFLCLAKKTGYAVSEAQVNHWKTFAMYQGKTIRPDYRTQCYALFILALEGAPQIGSMNLLKENHGNKLDGLSRELLATAYALAGKAAAGKELLKTSGAIIDDRELGETFGSPVRDLAMFTYLASIRGDQGRATRMLAEMAKLFRPGSWSSTHETGLAVIAVAEYNSKFGKASNFAECDLTVGGKTSRIKLQARQKQIDIPVGSTISITSKSASPIFASLSVSGVPMEDRIVTESKGIQIERRVYNEQGHLISPNQLIQSKPVWVVMKVNSQWQTSLDQLALSMLIPAGWEIVNTRLTGEPYPAWLGSVSNGTFADIRDDRINWFFNLASYSSQSFAVKVTPSFTGTFALPPVSVETMYSPDYFARIAGGVTKVVK